MWQYTHYIKGTTPNILAPWSFRHLPGAMARGHLRVPGPPQEYRQGGAAGTRPFLRALDPGPVYEAGRDEWRVDADVPRRMPRSARVLGGGV